MEVDSTLDKLEQLVQSATPIPESDITSLTTTLFDSGLGSIAVRGYITRLVSIIRHPNFSNSLREDVIPPLLSALDSSQLSLEEQSIDLRFLLADAYEASDDYLEAAKTLSQIPLNSPQKQMSDEERGKIIIRTVRLYLEVGDPTSAETHLNRFKNIMHEVHDKESLVFFQLSQARIYDSRRDFLAASMGYHDLSRIENIDHEEQMKTLSEATKCAVLAPAGPARSKMLKRLYDDDRAERLENYTVLENMHLTRLIPPRDVEAFAEGLAEHQMALLADGSTVLQRAMFEHNLLAVSKIYDSIHNTRLGELLGMDAAKAEGMTAGMIQQGRLLGRIDGIDGWIFFEAGEATGESSVSSAAGQGGVMKQWDSNVEGLTRDVESVFSAIQAKHPEWVERELVIET